MIADVGDPMGTPVPTVVPPVGPSPVMTRHPAASLWQSALHHTLARAGALDRFGAFDARPDAASGLSATAGHPRMEEATAALSQILAEEAGAPLAIDAFDLGRVGRVAGACASLYAKLAFAKFMRDEAAIDVLESELAKSPCDPFWATCLVEYERLLLQHREQIYPTWTSLDDAVLATLPDKATVGVIADWGTGMDDARALLAQVASFRPDVVVHLGDIYYSGTEKEADDNFLRVFAQVFGADRSRWPMVLNLSGNHDRYCGGAGYFRILSKLGHFETSFFCLRNGWWQLLGMDTGLHDAAPLATLAGSDLTWLEPSEVEWLQDKIARSGKDVPPASGNRAAKRGTILLSHHQLFSDQGVGKDDQGRRLAVNPHLHEALAKALPDVSLWLWGHEHDLEIYEPYAGLARGRCIGAGAVPVFAPTASRGPAPGLACDLPGLAAPPVRVSGTGLTGNGVVMNHCYAILRLDGPLLEASYYQVDTTVMDEDRVPPPPRPTFVERVDWTRPS